MSIMKRRLQLRPAAGTNCVTADELMVPARDTFKLG